MTKSKRKVSLAGILNSAASAARGKSSKAGKAITKTAATVAGKASRPIVDALSHGRDADGDAWSSPDQGTQADYRTRLLKAWFKVTGKVALAANAPIDYAKLRALIDPKQAIDGGSAAKYDGKIWFTSRGVDKYGKYMPKAKK